MPDKTTNYKLIKPRPEEPYNIADQNQNMELIDTALTGKQNKTITGQGEPTAATVGVIGQHYLDVDTATEYLCLGHDETVGYIWVTPFLVGSGAKIDGVFEVKDYFKVGPDRVYVTRRLMGEEADFAQEVNVGGSLTVEKSGDIKGTLTVGQVDAVTGYRRGNLVVFGSSTLADDVTIGRVDADGSNRGHLTVLGQIFARAATFEGTVTTRGIVPYQDGAPSIGSSSKKYNTVHAKKIETSEHVSTPKVRPPQGTKFIKFMCAGKDTPEESPNPVPVVWGGTGASTPKKGLENLGLRVVDNVLQHWDGTAWKDVDPPGKSYSTFGVRIDTANSNPATAVTYTDDAVGMTGGASAWDAKPIFKAIRPCVLKDGVVQYYLNPLNFAQKADGTAAVITSETEGDVMIEIPKAGFKITTNGNYVDVKITDNPNAEASGFHYYAHTRSIEGDRAKLYLGAYLGSSYGGELHSISGVNLLPGSYGSYIEAGQARGAGYDVMGFYPWLLLQCLYLIKYKNLNSQAALGQGAVQLGYKSFVTGETNANGMCWGDQSGVNRVKLFGLEDFWGAWPQCVGGLYCDANGHILTAFRDFNATGVGYLNQGSSGFTAQQSTGWIKNVHGTTELGFIASAFGGSDTTFFSDKSTINTNSNALFGGRYDSGYGGGAFSLNITSSATGSHSIAGRLMYL